MVCEKVSAARILFKSSLANGHRSLIVLVGDKFTENAEKLFELWLNHGEKREFSMLWCHKKKSKIYNQLRQSEDDASILKRYLKKIKFCFYDDLRQVLGRTFDVLFLQDFKQITPNHLAITIETVQRGGCIFLQIPALDNLLSYRTKIHSTFCTESHDNVIGRFNHRLALTFKSCKNILVFDESLNLLSSEFDKSSLKQGVRYKHNLEKRENLTEPLTTLYAHCKTQDQANTLLQIVDSLLSVTALSRIAITAPRGRGKSAVIGLALAGILALGDGPSSAVITAPFLENVQTFFEFLCFGLELCKFRQHTDFDIEESSNHLISKLCLRRESHLHTIRFVDAYISAGPFLTELMIIEEAAAIPLSNVNSLIGLYPIILSSTTGGYEGTGRSLSMKLLKSLRKDKELKELTLSEPIRYESDDPVEIWLSSLLFLESEKTLQKLSFYPVVGDCELYSVNRDLLFSFTTECERVLQIIASLLVSSHYRNSPNDIQLMADAPAHELFVLVGSKLDGVITCLPEILCVIQLAYEGSVSKAKMQSLKQKGQKSSGDMIPWIICEQFSDDTFPSMEGARIVRIACHPDCQRLGYGSQALALLHRFFKGELISLYDEKACIKQNLLNSLSKIKPPALGYIGASYGLTEQLFNFWQKAGYFPFYVRQVPSPLTGEHTCIMLHSFNENKEWFYEFNRDFMKKFAFLLRIDAFRKLSGSLCLNMFKFPNCHMFDKYSVTVSKSDLDRLERYAKNLVDYHLIFDLLPKIAFFYFLTHPSPFNLSKIQRTILLCLGFQYKSVEDVASELQVPVSQIRALLSRMLRVFAEHFDEKASSNGKVSDDHRSKFDMSLEDELEEGGRLISKKLKKYAIKGSAGEWARALGQSNNTGIVSVGHTAAAAADLKSEKNNLKSLRTLRKPRMNKRKKFL